MTDFFDRGEVVDVVKALSEDTRLNIWFDIVAQMYDIEDIRNSYKIVRARIAEEYPKLNSKYVTLYIKYYCRLIALEISEFEKIIKSIAPTDFVLKKLKPIGVIEDDKLALQGKINNFLKECVCDLDNVDQEKLDIVINVNKSLNQASNNVTAIREITKVIEKNPVAAASSLIEWQELTRLVFNPKKEALEDGSK